MHTLQDRFGRRFSYLRLSVTEVCNFRCQYCLPDGFKGSKRGFLTVPEIRRLVRAFAELGTFKVRLTGGEPTVRRDFDEILAAVAETSGIERVAMTTNAYRLAKNAAAWKSAGLDAVNVSLDALGAESFQRITGDRRFAQVMAGIDQALAVGLDSVKINTVLLRELNDDQLPAFFDFVRHRPVSLRFIELMQTGDNRAYFERHHVPGSGIRTRLENDGWQPVVRGPAAGPAVEYAHPDHAGRIGMIAPYAAHFCDDCNRLRVTARGALKLCLFGNGSSDLRTWLQHDDQTEALKSHIMSALFEKPPTHFLHQGRVGDTPHLASTGG
ncbi:MAG: GTP 3',8-cyclase MoaA [Wenzhouxiangella sp.]|nr:GTP 3',8-cyclase MoaA [Wenzhouxiangella sp.]